MDLDSDSDSLVHSPQLYVKKSKIVKTSNKNKCMNMLLFMNMILTSLCLVYLILLTNKANQININSLDINKENEYIKKLEIIIDYVCGTYIDCN